MTKEQSQITMSSKLKPCEVINFGITAEELRELEKLKSVKWAKYNALLNCLFMQKFPDFFEKSKFGVFIPYTDYERKEFVKKVQFRIDADTAAQLEQLRGRTGLTRSSVARMMIMPAMREELDKYKERK